MMIARADEPRSSSNRAVRSSQNSRLMALALPSAMRTTATPSWCASSIILSSRVDAAEAVPHSCCRTRQQHADITQLLVLAVERDARQRGQMIAMSGEEHTRAGRHCGLEAELGGYAEFPGSCRTRISYRIGKMIRALSERGRNHRAAHLHLRARGLFRHFCQHHMIDGMRTNGNERVGGQCGKLIPFHAELVTESSDVDLVAAGEIAYRMTQLILALEAVDPLIELLV